MQKHESHYFSYEPISESGSADDLLTSNSILWDGAII